MRGSLRGCGHEYDQSEEYSLWCDRMRVMFSAPFSSDEEHPTIYDRTCSRDPFSNTASSTETCPQGDETATKPTLVDMSQHPEPSRFADEDRFPFCFYARMLDSARRDRKYGSAHKAKFSTLGNRRCSSVGKDGASERQNAHRDENDAETCERMAHSLRTKLSRDRQAKQAQCCASSQSDTCKGCVSESDTLCSRNSLHVPFCDAKVEKIQAEIYDELTSLLLSVRRRNMAYARLRACQQQSHLMHLHAGRCD